MKRAVILYSGGIDSTVALALARAEGYALYALSLDYGQRHAVEIQRAGEIGRLLGVAEHRVLKIDLRQIGGSALTADLPMPQDRSQGERAEGIPLTYVPARNTIFLSIALGWAEVLEAEAIFIGVNVLDYSGYPDCRPEFIRAFEELARLATRAGVEGKGRGRGMLRVVTPLIHLTKAEIIQKGRELDAPLHLTHSCYDPTARGEACGRCDSCILRRKGFEEAGVKDPTVYVPQN